MKRRVTLKQVAIRAKVHLSTVSLALRNDPRLPEKTRSRIQKLAAKMGYIPDAAMSALAAYRNTQRPHPVQSGLAFLTDMERDDPFAQVVYEAAKAQASKMGYNLIWFSLAEKEASLERFQTIWWSTGLRGVLLGPFRRSGTVLTGKWEQWPIVAYGYSVTAPAFNRAVFNHFQNMLDHLEELRSRGYVRIGFCLTRELSGRTQGQLHAAYLLDQARHPKEKPIPVLRDVMPTAELLSDWVRKNRIDAVISYESTYQQLLKGGWEIPHQLGFSLLSTWGIREEKKVASFAGFNTHVEDLAATAISFLVSLIHDQAYGILHPARSYMLGGEYQEGETVKGREARPNDCATV